MTARETSGCAHGIQYRLGAGAGGQEVIDCIVGRQQHPERLARDRRIRIERKVLVHRRGAGHGLDRKSGAPSRDVTVVAVVFGEGLLEEWHPK